MVRVQDMQDWADNVSAERVAEDVQPWQMDEPAGEGNSARQQHTRET